MAGMPLVWTKEKVIEEIVNPFLYENKTMVQISKDLGMQRARVYVLLKRYGFNHLCKQRANMKARNEI